MRERICTTRFAPTAPAPYSGIPIEEQSVPFGNGSGIKQVYALHMTSSRDDVAIAAVHLQDPSVPAALEVTNGLTTASTQSTFTGWSRESMRAVST